jgi:hypothetical protein
MSAERAAPRMCPQCQKRHLFEQMCILLAIASSCWSLRHYPFASCGCSPLLPGEAACLDAVFLKITAAVRNGSRPDFPNPQDHDIPIAYDGSDGKLPEYYANCFEDVTSDTSCKVSGLSIYTP